MKGAGTIQAMITSLKSNRVRGRWRRPFFKGLRRTKGTVLRWRKSSPEVLKAIQSKIRRQRRLENQLFIWFALGLMINLNGYL